MSAHELTQVMSQIAMDKKAKDVILFDFEGQSSVCDIQMICSADSGRQGLTISEAIEDKIKQLYDIKPLYIEGRSEGEWIYLDYGSVLVHILQKEARSYYRIEEIWKNVKTTHVEPVIPAVH